MGAMRKATFLAVLMMISGLAGCFGADEDEDTDEIVAVFTYSPATNIRAGQTIDFDARDSLPSGVALTYNGTLMATIPLTLLAELPIGRIPKSVNTRWN